MFVFFSLLHFFLQKNFFLNLLLVFELISLCVYLVCVCFRSRSFRGVGLYLCVVFLCLGVCESVLGLAVLVNSSRGGGSTWLKSFSFLKF